MKPRKTKPNKHVQGWSTDSGSPRSCAIRSRRSSISLLHCWTRSAVDIWRSGNKNKGARKEQNNQKKKQGRKKGRKRRTKTSKEARDTTPTQTHTEHQTSEKRTGGSKVSARSRRRFTKRRDRNDTRTIQHAAESMRSATDASLSLPPPSLQTITPAN